MFLYGRNVSCAQGKTEWRLHSFCLGFCWGLFSPNICFAGLFPLLYWKNNKSKRAPSLLLNTKTSLPLICCEECVNLYKENWWDKGHFPPSLQFFSLLGSCWVSMHKHSGGWPVRLKYLFLFEYIYKTSLNSSHLLVF